jgi:hypothetical protein
MKKVDIYVINGEMGGGDGCGGSCGTGSEGPMTPETFVENFNKKNPDLAEFVIHNFDNQPKEEMITSLNKTLATSARKLTITGKNFSFMISQVLPIIAVNDNIVSLASCLNVEDLNQAIISESPVAKSSGCC